MTFNSELKTSEWNHLEVKFFLRGYVWNGHSEKEFTWKKLFILMFLSHGKVWGWEGFWLDERKQDVNVNRMLTSGLNQGVCLVGGCKKERFRNTFLPTAFALFNDSSFSKDSRNYFKP